MNDKNNNFKEINNNEISLDTLKVRTSFDYFAIFRFHEFGDY